MRAISLLILTAGFALLSIPINAAEKPARSNSKEDPKLSAAWKELEGRWKKTGIANGDGGGVIGDISNLGVEIVISRDGVETYRDGKLVSEKSLKEFRIDPTKDPAHLDIVNKPKNLQPYTQLFIYRIKGDKLQYVYNRLGNERPMSFELDLNNRKLPTLEEFTRVKSD